MGIDQGIAEDTAAVGERVASAPFLSGGGEMGALMRAKDWSQTALGPVERWPQALRTTVSTCLNSRFPIVVWWGPQMCTLYNDGYRPMLGAKHPRVLGVPSRECWPEIWDYIAPMFASVLERGEATWSENQMLPLERHGFPEECYFTFSYSPIHDEGDRIGGVFCAVTETTRQVLSDRRFRALREVADRVVEAASEPQAGRAVVDALARNAADTPFALLYLRRRGSDAIDLVASFAADGGAQDVPWRFADAAEDGAAVLMDPIEPIAGCTRALVVPFGALGSPAGFLVAGLSSRLVLDEEYRAYVEAVAARAGTAIEGLRTLDDARERAQRLAELDHAKTVFFSNVSHELRTPLTLMAGPMEDALARPVPVLEGEDLRAAYRGTQRLLKLVNALLDFSRIEAGRMQAKPEPVDICAFTRDIASSFRSIIEHAGLEFQVDCEGSTIVAIDRDMWEKIVLNLLSNAFKFTLEGRIRVALDTSPEAVMLRVEDTGSGIAAEDQRRLFQRFVRIDNPKARTVEGSGIGLALVQELVQMQGGQVRVESEPDRGSAFIVEVPRRAAGMQASAVAAPSRAAPFVEEAEGWVSREPAAAATGGGGTEPLDHAVLVVDDNADMRAYLTRLLSPHWTVESVADGESALHALDRRRFDLVLTDVMMPGLGGFALLDAIRRRRDSHALRVVMLSARAGEEARIEGLQAGADDYIVKPFNGRELVARVRSQLQLMEARHDMAIERMELLAREELARHEARLTREHFRLLLMQAPTAMCILRGPSYVVELANPPMCAAWQVNESEVRDRPLFEAIPAFEGQGFREQLDRVRNTGEILGGRAAPVRMQGGGVRYFDYVYAPYRGPDGPVEGVLVTAYDVTRFTR